MKKNIYDFIYDPETPFPSKQNIILKELRTNPGMKFYVVYLTGTGKNGETPGSPRYATQ
ncbi:MAG: hypothetical protein IPK46_03150 [Saprospiraceae bacterium]|nr:hypothetical protein [Saprospiraceae bacterium]